VIFCCNKRVAYLALDGRTLPDNQKASQRKAAAAAAEQLALERLDQAMLIAITL
jgi:hypothetical protein